MSEEYESFCFMCKRPESVTGRMLRLSDGLCVCNDCLQRTIDMSKNMNFSPEMFSNMDMPFSGMFNIKTPENDEPDEEVREEETSAEDETTPEGEEPERIQPDALFAGDFRE